MYICAIVKSHIHFRICMGVKFVSYNFHVKNNYALHLSELIWMVQLQKITIEFIRKIFFTKPTLSMV